MAIKTKDELKELSSTTFYDNDLGGITPEDHRQFNEDMIDSMAMDADCAKAVPTTAAFGTGTMSEFITFLRTNGLMPGVGTNIIFFSNAAAGTITTDAGSIPLARARVTVTVARDYLITIEPASAGVIYRYSSQHGLVSTADAAPAMKPFVSPTGYKSNKGVMLSGDIQLGIMGDMAFLVGNISGASSTVTDTITLQGFPADYLQRIPSYIPLQGFRGVDTYSETQAVTMQLSVSGTSLVLQFYNAAEGVALNKTLDINAVIRLNNV